MCGHSTFICILFFLWRFDTIPGHGVSLQGFAITVVGHTTPGRGLLWTSDQPYAWTTPARDKYPRPHQRDSNPQSQQAIGRIPTPQITGPLGSAFMHTHAPKINFGPAKLAIVTKNSVFNCTQRVIFKICFYFRRRQCRTVQHPSDYFSQNTLCHYHIQFSFHTLEDGVV